MNNKQLEELLLQSLEHELGGVNIYATAVSCAVRSDLKEEWQKYLAETRTHVEVLENVCKRLRVDTNKKTPGRAVVKSVGEALVRAMEMVKETAEPAAAQLVACECVVLAETKDHSNWTLIGKCAENLKGDAAAILKKAYDDIEDQEDEHLYHTKGWCRELWIESLGINAVLPPPEEVKHVKTAIGAARAEQWAEATR